MGVLLIGFADQSDEYTPLGIKRGLQRKGFGYNQIYNRMKTFGNDIEIPAMEYFDAQNVVGVYVYSDEISRVIPAALKIIREALPGFQPQLVGLGSCEIDGAKVQFKNVSTDLEHQINSLLR